MLASADDDVFRAAGNENVASGHIGAVAGIEPAVMEQLLRFSFIAKNNLMWQKGRGTRAGLRAVPQARARVRR